ncbi:MAG: glutamyl-tRNA reductase [Planctomycetaceae bacterium]|jgi:glutamyl-tRNA reductase|nr:glutamyl-tRNA reductase [Planctomycetaceae bacterium]
MLRVIGLNYRSAPQEVRERLAFSPAQTAAALNAWQDKTADTEAVLLSTCNRTEFYIADQNGELPAAEHLLQFLLDQKFPEQNIGVTASPAPAPHDFTPYLFTLDGTEAAEHLFAVAAGLDSMVLGEVQILSQVKAAYGLAYEADTAGTYLNTLFQSALKTAKRTAAETDLHKHRISVPSIAVADFAMQIFDRLGDKNILVLGAGETGRETVRYLIEYGAKNITILNRHRERAAALSAEFGAAADDWERRFDLMVGADIIVSATSSPEPIVSLADYKAAESKRQGRTLLILDLAVPRDFEPSIGTRSGVYLLTVDDLRAVCDKNRQERDKEIPKAKKIVQQAAAEFMKEMVLRRSGAVIQQLQERWTKTKDAELQRLFNKLPELDEKEREEIRYAFHRLMAKYIHSPLASLRDESADGEPYKLLDSLKKLFRL